MKFKSMAAATAVMLCGATLLSSCDNSTLSAGAAKDALKKEAVMQDSALVRTFKLGYYEVSTTDLTELAQLQAAGVITYRAERVIQKKKRYTYSYSYYSPSYYYEDIPHVFATVEMTPEGTKYVVENVPTNSKDYEKDMGLDNKKEVETPSYMDAIPEIANLPKVEEKVEAPQPATDEVVAVEEIEADVVESEPAAAVDVNEYEKALSNVFSFDVNVLVGKYKVVKAKNIYCPKNLVEQGSAGCDFIVEFVNRTPFGWVLDNRSEGERFVWPAVLIRYQDQGWRVKSLDR